MYFLILWQVAIKTIKKAKIETEADLVRIRREIQIMSSVQHPNIIHIYEGEFVFLVQ